MVGVRGVRGRRTAWIAVVATFLSVGAWGQSGSDNAVDDAPPGSPTVTATVG